MDGVHRIERESVLSSLAEPHRLEILRRLMRGPSTISRIGREMSRYPAWVRHHVKRLEQDGLVQLAEVRTTRNFTEKYYVATSSAYRIDLLLLPETGGSRPITIFGSNDIALERLSELAHEASAHAVFMPLATGSLDGLIALRQGMADAAGCHLLDVDSEEYNLPFVRHLLPDRDVVLVTLAHREQGFIYRAGGPVHPCDVADLAHPELRFVNRNGGSGTRLWLDAALARAGMAHSDVRGYEIELDTHSAVAEAIANRLADVGLGIRAAAEDAGLAFEPLFTERYDIVMNESTYQDPRMAPLLDRLNSSRLQRDLKGLAGYRWDATGREVRLAS